MAHFPIALEFNFLYTHELSLKMLVIKQKTCWLYKQKIYEFNFVFKQHKVIYYAHHEISYDRFGSVDVFREVIKQFLSR